MSSLSTCMTLMYDDEDATIIDLMMKLYMLMSLGFAPVTSIRVMSLLVFGRDVGRRL